MYAEPAELAFGLGLTLLEPSTVRGFITSLPLPADLERELVRLARSDTVAYACLAASPLVLAVGSLLPGIQDASMGRTQHAPRLATIAVALVFVVIGVAGTFGKLIPAIAGYSGERIGIGSYVVATVILLLGVFFRRI